MERRHGRAFRLALLLASVALLGAVGASAGPSATQAPTGVAAIDGGLSGRWLLVGVASTQADLIAVGEVRSEVRVGTLFDLDYQDGRLYGPGELCEFRLESPTSLVQIEFPERFRKALAPPLLDARVEERDGVLHFEQPRVVSVVGAALRQPRREPLPERPDDPRVVDADADGKPGVTVLVRGLIDGEIYLVQRNWNALNGHAVSSQRFEGTLLHGKEEAVLGATHDILAAFPPTRPDIARSYFVLERVPSWTTCSDVSSRMKALLRPGQ